MKKLCFRRLGYLSAFVLLAVAVSAGCGRSGRTGEEPSDTVEYNPFVDAFTSGRVSRFAPVYLILSEEVPEARRGPAELAKALRITPAVEGQFSMENEYTVVFRPKESFRRDTRYTITAELSQWFDTPGEYRAFSFPFNTMPLSLRAYFTSINVAAGREGFDVLCVVNTPDREEGETVESLVLFSEQAETEWSHAADGRRHEVTLRNVVPQDRKRSIILVAAPNKLGVKEEVLLEVNIPGRNDFLVYSVEYVTDPQRYVEVTFTEELDPNQDLRGIAYIEDNVSELVSIEANRIRLYPDSGRDGVVDIFLGSAIKSRTGLRLGEDIVRQVTVSMLSPQVRFAGSGTIIPVTDHLSVPFQAVNLRGVIVDVVRIFENNMWNFLQTNQLDGGYGLAYVGTPIAGKVIFLDDGGEDLGQWNTFALDLKEIMKPEPGAIYRVTFRINRDLSVYPCADEEERKSKEQIITEADAEFRAKKASFDNGRTYSIPYDWYDYSYYDRENPCTTSYEGYRQTVSANILATNIGLIAKAGETGTMTVMAHNILTAQPERGVAVTVFNFQNRVLGKGTTNERGRADITLSEGIPHYIVASQGTQRSYLRVDRGSALSMSSFDVSGESVQNGIKGFLYGERGIWRPGDTLHMAFMLNDRTGRLPAGHPVTVELFTPLGQLYSTRTQTKNELGLYTFDIPTEPDAQTGAWTLKAAVGGVQFAKKVRIEAIKPNRLKIDLQIGDRMLRNDKPVNIPLHVEWLQGATARNLRYEINTTYSATVTRFKGFEGYVFDDPAKTLDREERLFSEGNLDADGNALIKEKLYVDDSAPGMLNVGFTTRVFEESGDFSVDGRTARFSPYDIYVGVKSPQTGKRHLNTGVSHIYDVAAVDADGKPVGGLPIEVSVYKLSWYWWWSSNNDRLASYISNHYEEPVRKFTIRTKENGQGSFNLQFTNNEWGTYFIRLSAGKGGHSTGVTSYFDWPYLESRSRDDNADAAMQISVTTDREEYSPGDRMRVSFPSPEGGRAVISIENGTKVVSLREIECADEETSAEIEVTADMQPNVFVHVTLLQPYASTTNDRPIRLYGVQGVTVTAPESRLHPVVKAADELRPQEKYSVTVSERDGRQMAYTLAVVDEGLLDLTHFRTPDPWQAFNAREALGVRTWDLYNHVMGAYGGRIEQIFSIGGDDEAGADSRKASTNRFAPVVKFEGPFMLKKGESRTHNFDMPNYTGRVRVMAVAGDGSAYGNAEKSVMVRKPVMLLGTLPRVIGVDEEMTVPATVFATEKGVGNVKVSIKVSGNMSVEGPSSFDLDFGDTGDKIASFRIAVGSVPGTGRVTITAVSKKDRAEYDTDIEIRSVSTPQTKVTAYTVEPGQTLRQKADLFGMDGTNRLTLEVSDVKPVNLVPRLGYLIGFPHGCIEQITSKGFPQLYLADFVELSSERKLEVERNVKAVISRMKSYQTSSGAFAYWPGGSTVYSWATPYATHFLLEAEAKGYLVPAGLKNNAMAQMRRDARGFRNEKGSYFRSEQYSQAYRLYVLALGGAPETGAMNRLKEADDLIPMAKWMLAAAYAKIGRQDVARELIEKAADITFYYDQYDLTFGSELRDRAVRLMVLTMLGDNAAGAVAANEISDKLSSDEWMSTQTTAYALMAMSQYMQKFTAGSEMDFSYSSGGRKGNVKTAQHLWNGVMFENSGGDKSVEIKNNGTAAIFVRLIVDGIPEHGKEEAYSNGIRLAVRYLDSNGRVMEVNELEQGTAFSVQAVVSNTSGRPYRNIVLTQVFPSGWEILNTRWLDEDSGDPDTPGVSYQDFRDDRVYTHIDFLPSDTSVTVDIGLAAIYPGLFHLPPADVRAMYDNTVRANNKGDRVRVK